MDRTRASLFSYSSSLCRVCAILDLGDCETFSADLVLEADFGVQIIHGCGYITGNYGTRSITYQLWYLFAHATNSGLLKLNFCNNLFNTWFVNGNNGRLPKLQYKIRVGTILLGRVSLGWTWSCRFSNFNGWVAQRKFIKIIWNIGVHWLH